MVGTKRISLIKKEFEDFGGFEKIVQNIEDKLEFNEKVKKNYENMRKEKPYKKSKNKIMEAFRRKF